MKRQTNQVVFRHRPVKAYSLHPVAITAIETESAKMGLTQSQWLSWFLMKSTGYDPLTGKKVLKAS